MTTEAGMTSQAKPASRNTFALMGLAALLIVNSHLEPIYPLSFMAGDGLVGNLVFFVVSGFGVTMGQMHRPYALIPFYLRRIWRIYPSVVAAVLVGLLLHTLHFDFGQPAQWLKKLIWPTDYGFIAKIIIFYPLLWGLARIKVRVMKAFVTGLAAVWFGVWIFIQQSAETSNLSLGQLPGELWWSFFLLATCLGALIAREPIDVKGRRIWFIGAPVAALYLGLKIELALRLFTTPIIFSSALLGGILQVLALALVVVLLVGIHPLNQFLAKLKMQSVLEWVGKASLQLYLLHTHVLDWMKAWPLPWPARLVLVFALSVALAELVLGLLNLLPQPNQQKAEGLS